MPTSGSTDFVLNARQVIKFALKLIRVIDGEEEPSASDAADALLALNLMLKSWQIKGPHLARQTIGSVTLTANTESYVLNPQPYRVIEVRYRDANGRDVPMIQLTRQEYIDLPLKNSPGIPTQYYYDVQRDETLLSVWPVLAAENGDTAQYTFQRKFEDIDQLGNEIDIPQEWLETVAYCLADRCQPLFGTSLQMVTVTAERLLAEAMQEEREDFITFVPEYRY